MATADAADKGKLYCVCSTPELSERNFAMVLKWSFHHQWVGYRKLQVHQKQLRKTLLLVLLSVSDCKRAEQCFFQGF